MSLTWLSNTNIKKLKRPKPTERGEENQVQQRERESTPFRATAELLSTVSPPLSWQRLGGSAALFKLETTTQPQRHHYDQNPSRTSEEEPKKESRKTRKNEQKYEQPKLKTTNWTTSKNPARNAERGRNPSPKCKQS